LVQSVRLKQIGMFRLIYRGTLQQGSTVPAAGDDALENYLIGRFVKPVIRAMRRGRLRLPVWRTGPGRGQQ
jgi:hypothetical protein